MTTFLDDYVTRAAAADPSRTAVVLGDQRMSYGELDTRSDLLARRLGEVGTEGDRACVLAAKKPETVVGIVAALKARRVYVPIDVASPAIRVERFVRAADPRWVLADAAGSDLVSALEMRGVLDDAAIARLDELSTWSDASVQRAERSSSLASHEVDNTHPAYIMFTSGSSGEPKGVVITHDNVTPFVEWALRHFGVDRTDRVSGHAPLHFDLSVFDLFVTFAAGAELHLVPAEASLVPDVLLELIRSSELTQWFSVPSLLSYVATHGRLRDPDLPSLKRVLTCGEVLPTTTLMTWMRHIPHATFTNLYGPTETTVASSYFTVPSRPSDPREPVPIGRACDGEELLVLNDDLSLALPGEPGELCIGGVGVSPGYWRDDERSRAVFVGHPFPSRPGELVYRTGDIATVDEEGVHRFLGRRDDQIKSRGYRIELGEIETAIGGLKDVGECVVVASPTSAFQGPTVCCAFAACPGIHADVRSLRRRLAETLPTYMVPVRWKILDALPRNANGKIDRRAVLELFESEDR